MKDNVDLINGIEALENDNFELALSLAKKIQTEFPNQAEGFHLEGLICQYQSDWEGSIDAFSNAIKQSPYDPDLFNFRGFARMNLGQLADAELDLKEAIELEDYEPAHRNYVLWLIISDRSEDAVEYLTNRIQTKQNDPENFALMGDLMMKVGREDIAQSYYTRANDLTNSKEV